MSTDRDEMVRVKAYHTWNAEGRQDGQHDRHWRDAESEFATAEGEELAHKGSDTGDVPGLSSDLPKVGEFSSASN